MSSLAQSGEARKKAVSLKLSAFSLVLFGRLLKADC
jgi:hypothetical protein